MPYLFRNADADELLFVHAGAGRLETDFGPLAYEPGDYLVIPRGTAVPPRADQPDPAARRSRPPARSRSPIAACSASTRCSIPR